MGTYQEILVILHITTGSSQYKYNATTNLISCISILFMNNMKYDWLRAIDCGIYGWLMLLLVQFIPLRRQVLLLPAAGSGVS